MSSRACASCLAHSWLLGRLAGHLDCVRARIAELLELDDERLIEAVGGRDGSQLAQELRARRTTAPEQRRGVESICPCDADYPPRLRQLAVPPVLHVTCGLDRFLALCAGDPVAIVGSRRASAYGIELARSLSRELATAGLTVISGMAPGIDAAAHTGALEAGGATIALLPGPADRPYPTSKARLHRSIVERGAAVSELVDATSVRRWMFLARNRLIAALSAMTVVVEATAGSGSLVTVRAAKELHRPVGAVPGRVTTPQATVPLELLAEGALLVRGAQDVLDHLFGAGSRIANAEQRPELGADGRRLLGAIAEGTSTQVALERTGLDADRGLALLAAMELDGYIRRGPSGKYEVVP